MSALDVKEIRRQAEIVVRLNYNIPGPVGRTAVVCLALLDAIEEQVPDGVLYPSESKRILDRASELLEQRGAKP